MRTFNEYMNLEHDSDAGLQKIQESLQSEWTPELEAKIDEALDEFVSLYKLPDGTFDINKLNEEMTNEGVLGSIFGGLTGFALGKALGKAVAKVLGVESGILYDMLTSRLVGAALGASLGQKL